MESATTNTAYIMHESEVARLERINRRFWILILILVFLLVATNGIWIWYESQWVDEVTETIETSADNGNAYGTIVSGSRSVVTYGESESNTD